MRRPRRGDWEVRRDGVQVSAHHAWLDAARSVEAILGQAGAVDQATELRQTIERNHGSQHKPASLVIRYADRNGKAVKLEVCQFHAFTFGPPHPPPS